MRPDFDPAASRLPIDELEAEFLARIRRDPVLVLSAPPGSGKTSRVPLWLLRSEAVRGCILVLQPRRLAARACAAQIARQLGEPLGRQVGFAVRFQRVGGPDTRIWVITEGILPRRMLDDPLLEGVGAVVLDEFHERSVHTDLAAAFLRETLQVRPDLRLVVMSATLETEAAAAFFGGAASLRSESAPHPLEIAYLGRPDPRPLPERTASGVRRLWDETEKREGSVLAFLPGARDIHRCARLLSERPLPGECAVEVLYGAMPAAAQDRVLQGGKGPRVILATNLAESSLTVPGVRAVVDSGYEKRLRHDPRSGLDRLVLGRISRQSAEQRAGRAARLGPGRVLRLWTAAEQAGLAAAEVPEICRLDLAGALLMVLEFHPGDPAAFSFLDPPPASGVASALELLRRLQAVEEGGFGLTPVGRRLARLPVHPRLGRMLLQAERWGCLERAALAAALIEEGEVLAEPPRRAGDTDSDLADRLESIRQWERRAGAGDPAEAAGLDPAAVRRVLRARDQLLRAWPRRSPDLPEDSRERARLLLAAYPDRVCRRREPGASRAVRVGGQGVELDETSGVRRGELFLALEAEAPEAGPRATARVRRAELIAESDLEAVFPEHLSTSEDVRFDPERQAVVGVERRRYLDLVLWERYGRARDAERVARALAEAAAADFESVFAPSERAQQLLARLGLARRWLPDPGWPDPAPEALRLWLPELCRERQRFEQLRRLDWYEAARQRIPARLRARLERELPERLTLPSGKSARLDYRPALKDHGLPVLAVRLQEVFGWDEAPRLAGGRLPVLLHLLAPNGRPAQITADLASFWREGYREVRKELRARYPRHDWPEDPRAAAARKNRI